MSSFLNYMDSLKESYIESQSAYNSAKYPSQQFYFYKRINYKVDESIVFYQSLWAVKLVKTAILFVDENKNTKVYFTDKDISKIIKSIDNQCLKTHIITYLKKIASASDIDKVSFIIHDKEFKIDAIQFQPEFNEILCRNPADIKINGNDLIALINLVLEKDRTDRDPIKIRKTAIKYIY